MCLRCLRSGLCWRWLYAFLGPTLCWRVFKNTGEAVVRNGGPETSKMVPGGVENEASGGRKWLPGGFRGDSGWPLAGQMATRGGGSKLSSVVCALLFFLAPKCASGGLLGRSWRLLGSFWASPPPPRRAPGGHFGRFFETSGAGPRKNKCSNHFVVCLFLC